MSAFEPYSISNSYTHGIGVYANQSFVENDIIFTEKPYLFLQTIPNRQLVLTCGECVSFLGNHNLQLNYLMKNINRSNISTENVLCACSGSCGEYYCNAQCRDLHWEVKGHKFLCTGFISEEEAPNHPLYLYKVHAIQTNEIFLLVAELFSRIVNEVEQLVSLGGNLIDSLSMMCDPLSSFVRNVWWEVAQPPDDCEDVDEFRTTLRNLVMDAWDLLNDFLGISRKGMDVILNPDYMARTIGMFEQNNVGVRLSSPVVLYISSLDSGQYDEIARIRSIAEDIANNIPDCAEDEWEDEGDTEELSIFENMEEGNNQDTPYHALIAYCNEQGEDTLFPPLDGTAFYMKICRINHSCEPNVIVKYTDFGEGKGLTAVVNVLRPIVAGEELFQSYIDQSLNYELRQAKLKDYGFTCNCRKCADRI
eukprot:gene13791-18498_t